MKTEWCAVPTLGEVNTLEEASEHVIRVSKERRLFVLSSGGI